MLKRSYGLEVKVSLELTDEEFGELHERLDSTRESNKVCKVDRALFAKLLRDHSKILGAVEIKHAE